MLRKTLPTVVLLALATTLAACDKPSVNVSANGTTVQINGDKPVDGGYKLEVVGDDLRRVVFVTAPDGRTAAAEVKDGKSALVAEADARTFMGERAAQIPAPTGQDKVNIGVGGFSLQVQGDGNEGKDGAAAVTINAGGTSVQVNAGGEGTNEAAAVTVGGVDADAARRFIDEQKGLSDATRAEMKAKVGL